MKKHNSIKNIGNDRIDIDFALLDSHFSFKLGRVNYSSAHAPLEIHKHAGMMEIVYIVKGRQVYRVAERDYMVNSGELFMTFPDELHSSGDFPEDKAYFYFLIIDLEKHKNDMIGFGHMDGEAIVKGLCKIRKRVFSGMDCLREMLDKIIDAYYTSRKYNLTLIRNYISLFLINVLECAEKADEGDASTNMQAVLDFIESNIEGKIDIGALAGISRLSVSRFKANFRRQTGIPPAEFVLRRKVEMAKMLLANTQDSIIDIAYRLSFSSSQYFSTVFKRFTFMSPKEYRKYFGLKGKTGFIS